MLSDWLYREDDEDSSRRGSIVMEVSDDGGVKGARLGSPDAGRYGSSWGDMFEEGVVKEAR